MAISSSLISGASFVRSETLIQNQERLGDFNRQLATGERSTTYGGLGSERVQSISLRQDISRLESFQTSIDRLNIRIELTSLSLERLEDIRIEARDAIDPNNFIDLGNGRTFTQQLANVSLTESVALLNSQSDGRFIFGGNNVETAPVEDLSLILEGDGVRAGLRDVTDQRLRADLGATGLGRLDLSITGNSVRLAEEAVTDFGFDLRTVDNNLSGVTAAITGTEPAALDVDFNAQPQIGEQFRLFLNLPDGSQSLIELQVATNSSDENSFTLGATPADTAANFEAALRDRLDFTARTELNAVSRIEAADNFFNTEGGQPPQRLDTPGTPETALGLVDGTAANTVFFYNGQNDADNPRDGITTRVDDSIVVEYGLRANEDALRAGITSLAAFAIGDFTSGTEDENQAIHAAFATRTSSDLAVQVDAPSIQSITQEIAGIQVIAGNAGLRHNASIETLTGFREDIERADPTEVAIQLLSLQTQIEASFSASARISEVSLLNFLPN